MVRVYLNNIEICEESSTSFGEIVESIARKTKLKPEEFYMVQNGKRISEDSNISACNCISVLLRLCGGKGGFGSMLRAIGAQIEKTTNREACRDLSGRRLRDINEEKRLKAWLDKQADREREAEERKKRKIEKLLAVPKHEFKDEKYEEARSKLTEKVNDAVEEGLKKSHETKNAEAVETADISDLKRKAAVDAGSSNVPNKKLKKQKNKSNKKSTLWIGDDISSCSDSDDVSETDSSESEHKAKVHKK